MIIMHILVVCWQQHPFTGASCSLPQSSGILPPPSTTALPHRPSVPCPLSPFLRPPSSVPVNLQVLYSNCVGLFWNIYLSSAASRAVEVAEEQSVEKQPQENENEKLE
mmetsp:Transcript_13653/g.25411  ORF Transcript_13653/g.25411 Transcript_13653/m.25411 type:complete len:108 (+) Transcript_13653:124-447(+)